MNISLQSVIAFCKQKYPLLIIVIFLFVLLLVNQYVWRKPLMELLPVTQTQEQKEDGGMLGDEERWFRALDGVLVGAPELTHPRTIAVMIENNSESWPLSGLESASVVYEVLSEGRIPRYLALFPYDQIPGRVGPVRSARTYYLELALPFDPVYMHVGGSPDALNKIKTFGLIDADQFFWSQYFWRAQDRYAPHNVFTNGELVTQMLDERGISLSSDFEGWLFKDVEQVEVQEDEAEKDYESIIINYTTSTYQSRYVYDPLRNQYQRYQARQPLVMRDGSEIWVTNVIVEEHPHRVYDSVGRRDIDIVGEGRVWVFRDGESIEGVWKKTNRADITRYYDDQGDEIILNRGVTWINIVEPETFTYEQKEGE